MTPTTPEEALKRARLARTKRNAALARVQQAEQKLSELRYALAALNAEFEAAQESLALAIHNEEDAKEATNNAD